MTSFVASVDISGLPPSSQLFTYPPSDVEPPYCLPSLLKAALEPFPSALISGIMGGNPSSQPHHIVSIPQLR